MRVGEGKGENESTREERRRVRYGSRSPEGRSGDGPKTEVGKRRGKEGSRTREGGRMRWPTVGEG